MPVNLLDYLVNDSIYRFDEKPFNDIDGLLMTKLTYLNWREVVDEKPVRLGQAADRYFLLNGPDSIGGNKHKRLYRMALSMMAHSNRYKDIRLMDYVCDVDYEKEKQFGAMTMEIGRKLYYVAFQGTDGMVASWKEDFNMAYTTPVPAQQDAEAYLHRQLKSRRGRFMVGGHSKGGNLAVYAAVKNLNPRIIKVQNFDGPGFSEQFIQQKNYQKMLPRMLTIVPESSIIGNLMNSRIEKKIVASQAREITEQHNGINWEVDDDDFKVVESQSEFSRFINEGLSDWFRDLSNQQKEVFINTVYDTITDMKLQTVRDLENRKSEFLSRSISGFSKYDPDTRNIMVQTLLSLLKSSGLSFVNTFFLSRVNRLMERNRREKAEEEAKKEE